MSRAVIALVFRCEITGGDLATTGGGAAFRWATRTEVPDLADEAYAVRVLDVLGADRPVAVRHHDGVHLIRPTPAVDRRPTHRVQVSDKAIRIGPTPDNDLALSPRRHTPPRRAAQVSRGKL